MFVNTIHWIIDINCDQYIAIGLIMVEESLKNTILKFTKLSFFISTAWSLSMPWLKVPTQYHECQLTHRSATPFYYSGDSLKYIVISSQIQNTEIYYIIKLELKIWKHWVVLPSIKEKKQPITIMSLEAVEYPCIYTCTCSWHYSTCTYMYIWTIIYTYITHMSQ